MKRIDKSLKPLDYLSESISATTNDRTNCNRLYDENILNHLQIGQMKREREVRHHLTSSESDFIDEIEIIREERRRILMNGEKQVKNYMAILKKEQEEFSIETAKLREQLLQLNSTFIDFVNQHEESSMICIPSVSAIKKRVKEHISQIDPSKAQTLASIDVSEIKASSIE